MVNNKVVKSRKERRKLHRLLTDTHVGYLHQAKEVFWGGNQFLFPPMLLVMPLKLENLPGTFQTRDFAAWTHKLILTFTCGRLRFRLSTRMEDGYR